MDNTRIFKITIITNFSSKISSPIFFLNQLKPNTPTPASQTLVNTQHILRSDGGLPEKLETPASEVPRVMLGSQGLEVSRIGLGCRGMSPNHGPSKPEPEMINLIKHAIDKGITFLDTSDQYGPHTNEFLIGKAIKGMRQKVQIASKFGIRFNDGKMDICGEPEYVRACCESSLKRLGIDYIDIYYVHRIDTRVPIEITLNPYDISEIPPPPLVNGESRGYIWHKTIGELKKLVEEGKIKYIGLSEACAATIRRAHAVHPITAVQMEWSLWTRDLEEEIVPTCRELGIGIVPYSPLGRGFFSAGPELIERLAEGDFRKNIPRFKPENFQHNKQIFEQFKEVASKKECTTSQLALAWVLHKGDNICPIPGTTKIENLNENIEAISVKLTADEILELESFAAEDIIKGDRHAFMWATWINSGTPPLVSWKSEQEITSCLALEEAPLKLVSNSK